jgi:hypothetical protein
LEVGVGCSGGAALAVEERDCAPSACLGKASNVKKRRERARVKKKENAFRFSLWQTTELGA